MQVLDIKRGHYKNLEDEGLERIMSEIFGDVEKDGDKLKANYDLGDQYRTDEVDAIESPLAFEDSATIGGEIRTVVTVPINHTQE